jgi:hypothetical protein
MAVAFQFFTAIRQSNFLLFLPAIIPLVLGPIIGGLLAFNFFTKFYQPLRDGL